MASQPFVASGENPRHLSPPAPSVWSSDKAWLIYIALVTVIVHLIVGNRYGFQRDELATLEDARHLAFSTARGGGGGNSNHSADRGTRDRSAPRVPPQL
jgi:hypothetical protein